MLFINIDDVDLSSIRFLRRNNAVVVFRVRHRGLGELVVKTSPCVYKKLEEVMNNLRCGNVETITPCCRGDRATERIIEEAEVLKALKGHRYMVEYYGDRFADLPAIVTKYYPRSLRDIVGVYGKRFSHKEAVRLLIKVGSALSHMHRHGYVHGDVKPSNILIGDDGEPKLADFSTALRVLEGRCVEAKGFTPGFSAPEQVGRGVVCYESDVYALASLYVYLVCGESPANAGACGVRLPRAVQRALAKDPTKRPSMDSFLTSLKDIVTEKEFFLEGLGKRFKLEPGRQRYVIGRSNACDIVINDEYVSHHHCELVYDEIENTWKVRDHGSLNGTIIERGNNKVIVFMGRRCDQSTHYKELARRLGTGVMEEYLQDGDKILIAYSFKTQKARARFKYVEVRHNPP